MLVRDFLSALAFTIGAHARGIAASVPFSEAKSKLDYGAKPDGLTLSTKASQRAIDEANGALVAELSARLLGPSLLEDWS